MVILGKHYLAARSSENVMIQKHTLNVKSSCRPRKGAHYQLPPMAIVVHQNIVHSIVVFANQLTNSFV